MNRSLLRLRALALLVALLLAMDWTRRGSRAAGHWRSHATQKYVCLAPGQPRPSPNGLR